MLMFIVFIVSMLMLVLMMVILMLIVIVILIFLLSMFMLILMLKQDGDGGVLANEESTRLSARLFWTHCQLHAKVSVFWSYLVTLMYPPFQGQHHLCHRIYDQVRKSFLQLLQYCFRIDDSTYPAIFCLNELMPHCSF